MITAHRFRLFPIFAFCVALALSFSDAQAQTAGMMSFQGYIKDAAGVPVNGTVNLLFDVRSSTTSLVTFNVNGVAATAGVVSTKYGPVLPSLFDGTSRFLRVTVTPVSPPGPAFTLADVEIVTPPAVAEQLNARGTGNPAVVADIDGSVGIGTATPESRLALHYTAAGGYVAGLPATWQALTLANDLSHGNSAAGILFQGSDQGDYDGKAGIAMYRTGAADASLALLTSTNNGATFTEAMTLFHDGKVGIGTSSPISRLDIRNDWTDINAPAQVSIRSASTAGALGLGFHTSGNYGAISSTEFNAGARPLALNPGGGNVGIGTTSPNERLAVVGSLALDGTNNFFYSRPTAGSNATATSLGFAGSVGGVLTLSNNGGNDIRAGRAAAGGQLRFFVNNTSAPTDPSNGIEAMTILSNGDVGIGASSPAARLEIAGSASPTALRVTRTGTGSVVFGEDNTGGFVQVLNNRPFSIYNTAAEIIRVTDSGNVGIGTSSPSAKLCVNGSIAAIGTLGTCSDSRFKTNITLLESALATLERLRAVRFDWRCDEFPDRNFDDTPQIGFIAQELLDVVPEVVQQGSDGYYSVDYGRLTPVLTAAIQEMNRKHQLDIAQKDAELAVERARIDKLTERLEKLEAALAANGEVRR